MPRGPTTAALAAPSPPCAKHAARVPTPRGLRRHARSVSRASSQPQTALLTQAHAPPASLAPTPPPTEQKCALAVPPGPSTGTRVGPVPLFAHHVPLAHTRQGRHRCAPTVLQVHSIRTLAPPIRQRASRVQQAPTLA